MTDAPPTARECGPQTLRVRLDLSYDGSAFNGWAAQPGLRTVEGVLASALSTVLRCPVKLTVAGRTDAGVHAAAQVVHLVVSEEAWARLPGRSDRLPEAALLTRLAGVLTREARSSLPGTPRGAADIAVVGARVVPGSFDARFSALSRRYTYRIADAGARRDPTRRGTVLWLPDSLDVAAMASSTAPLLGEHDFLSYCRPRAGATTASGSQASISCKVPRPASPGFPGATCRVSAEAARARPRACSRPPKPRSRTVVTERL